jgi:hypothetical protein
MHVQIVFPGNGQERTLFCFENRRNGDGSLWKHNRGEAPYIPGASSLPANFTNTRANPSLAGQSVTLTAKMTREFLAWGWLACSCWD